MWKQQEGERTLSILDLTAVELGRKIKVGQVSVEEATEAALGQIKRL